MRTQEKYDAALATVRWYVDFHKSPVWLVPVEEGYLVVITEPKPELLPGGTRAIQYGPGLVEMASIPAGDWNK